MPDDTRAELPADKAQKVNAAIDDLNDQQKVAAAAQIVRGVPDSAGAAANIVEGLPLGEQLVAATQSMNELPTDQKAAASTQVMKALPDEDKAAVARVAGLPSPSSTTADQLWLIVVIAFATLLVGSAIGVFVLTLTNNDAQILVPFVTAAVGVLAGLLASPGPRRTGPAR